MNSDDKNFVSSTLQGADIVASAIARLYRGSSGSWEFDSVGAAVIAYDPQNRSNYIHIVDLHNGDVPLFVEVYNGFEYSTPLPFFHYFIGTQEGKTDAFGFSFADEGEARSFADAIAGIPGVTVTGKSGGRPAAAPRAAPSVPSHSHNPPPAPPTHSRPPPPRPAAPPTAAPVSTPAPAATAPPLERNTSVGDKMRNMSSVSIPAATEKKKEEKKKKKGFFSRFFSKEESDDDENFEISDPNGFRHESHIGYDAETGGFDTKNIPAEWKRLFQAAGIRKKDLKDAETFAAVMQVVNESPAAPPAPPPPSSRAPPAPPAPAAPPAPPAPNAPPAPPAPPAPAAPPAPGAPPPPRAPAAPGGGAPPPPRPAPGGDRGSLLDEIRGGKQLKSVEQRSVSEIKAPTIDSDEGQNMIQKLSQVMSVRRQAIEDDDDDDENDEWSD